MYHCENFLVRHRITLKSSQEFTIRLKSSNFSEETLALVCQQTLVSSKMIPESLHRYSKIFELKDCSYYGKNRTAVLIYRHYWFAPLFMIENTKVARWDLKVATHSFRIWIASLKSVSGVSTNFNRLADFESVFTNFTIFI